jgi:tetratricopeptide (TPR) repeat protein
MLPYMSSKDQFAATPKIKEAVDRALGLDPLNDTAWHILGRWDRVLANISPIKRLLAKTVYGELPVTTNEEAEQCLQKAIAINPHRLIHYIELGRIYAEMGREEEARKYILEGLSMPNEEKDDPEMKEIGRETLKKLGYTPE